VKFLQSHLNRLQLAAWLLIFCLLFFSILQYDPAHQAFVYTMAYLSVYLIVIYGNTLWLIPKYFKSRKYLLYTIGALSVIAIAVFIRSYGMFYIFNHLFAEKLEVFKMSTIFSSVFSVTILFLVSILFGLALDYFKLRQIQAQLKASKDAAELHVLKQQLHPHFLFNTLNNIYYTAQKESPNSAQQIERLSEVLRYFLEASDKERVLLKEELHLIEHYVELERLRMLYPVEMITTISISTANIQIPPLLLMPIFENIFKHGIDKRTDTNRIYFSIKIDEEQLYVKVKNTIPEIPSKTTHGGNGLVNLKKRLALYYDHRFNLNIQNDNTVFSVTLSLPLEHV
jgi:sensor histidine kinase YesM